MTQSAARIERKRWTGLFERLPVRKRQELLSQGERYAQEVEERVRQLLRPRTREGGAGYVVRDSKTHHWGTGETREAAYADYRKALEVSYEFLMRDEDSLAPALEERLCLLRAVFESGSEW